MERIMFYTSTHFYMCLNSQNIGLFKGYWSFKCGFDRHARRGVARKLILTTSL